MIGYSQIGLTSSSASTSSHPRDAKTSYIVFVNVVKYLIVFPGFLMKNMSDDILISNPYLLPA